MRLIVRLMFLFCLLLPAAVRAQDYKPGEVAVVDFDGSSLTLWSGMSAESRAVTSLLPGTRLLITSDYGEWFEDRLWYHVRAEQIAGLIGWIGLTDNSQLDTLWDAGFESVVRFGDQKLAYDPTAAEYLERGLAHLGVEHYTEAMSDFEAAFQLLPNDPTGAYLKGAIYYRLKDYPQAIAALDQAIARMPSATAYHLRSLAYLELGDINGSFENATAAINLLPAFAPPYVTRGVLYEQTGQLDLALSDYDQAMELDDGYAAPAMNEARLYVRMGIPHYGSDPAQHAVDVEPANPEVYIVRGTIYSATDASSSALEDFEQAVALAPDDPDVYWSRGNAYYLMGEADAAVADMNYALSLDADNPIGHYNLGVILYQVGRFEEAIASYSSAIDMGYSEPRIYYNRGLAYTDHGDYQPAIDDFTAALATAPGWDWALMKRGTAYGNLGNDDLALADFDAALAVSAASDLVYYERAQFYEARQKWDAAIADYEHAIEISPNTPDYYKALGELYLNELRQPADADRYMQQYLALANRASDQWTILSADGTSTGDASQSGSDPNCNDVICSMDPNEVGGN